MKIRRITVWYEARDWKALHTLCSDLEPSYNEWRRYAEIGLQRQGLTENDIEKVVLTPDILRAHGASAAAKVSSNDRVKIAVAIAMEDDKKTRH